MLNFQCFIITSVCYDYNFTHQSSSYILCIIAHIRVPVYQISESKCWVFYAVPTARVIFTAKTCLDIFSLSQEQVWTFSVLGD